MIRVCLRVAVTCFCFVSNVQGGTSRMVRVVDYDNMLDERYEITDHAGLSHRGDCASLCHRDVRCVSFSYNILTGRCLLHSVHFYNMMRGVSQLGWRYFKLFTDKCPIDYVFNRVGKFCFKHLREQRLWVECVQVCNEGNASLLIIDTPEKQAELARQTRSSQVYDSFNYFLGGYKDEGTWRWIDGREITLTFWYKSSVSNWDGNVALHQSWGHTWTVLSLSRRCICEIVDVLP
ncbi:CD209 antigen-like protein C [Haliotis cracherodii]|uniref:CD209 antigen-like protein C n=1 Tax=Haliotis cracherodii TaxID=6455 RepID=UPI0039EA3F2F